jgi:pyruvate ferredoxin oxidoreductase gamma subunit
MEAYTEIRWHGRAQQGVVTAAKVLGETALREGKFVQAFPEFGPERMGAPVKAFNRVSEEPIKLHCQVTSPRIVLIVDPTVFTVDASVISMDTIGRHLPNTPMLGALSKATSIVELDSLVDNFRENYSKKFSPKVIEGNVEAMKRGFNEVKGESD